MKIFSRYIIGISLLTVVSLSCSTEKDAAINRGYHNMTAHFNGYYNAGVVIELAMAGYRTTYVDDYYSLLPLEVYPTEKDAPNLFPDMEKAIEKCERVILRHSMPNPAITKNKDKELCTWIDDNWLVIAKAHYIKREYLLAEQKLKYIADTYVGEESVYEAQIWLAKTYIELKNYPEAKRILTKVKISIDNTQASKDRKIGQKISDWKKGKKQRKKDKIKGTIRPAAFPKKLLVDYEATMADLFIEQEDYKQAIEHLVLAIELCKDRKLRARYMFVLAQLYEKTGDGTMAAEYYGRVAKSSAPYEMQFQAKINKALSATTGGAAIRKELNKMLRDDKNAEFKDQIYYALAEMDFKDGNVEGAKKNYSNSVYWSLKNNRQKGISYLRLADIHFNDKQYIPAQKYYDSCVKVMPEDYPDYEYLKGKASGLADLVFNYETVVFEDSVQAIANMSEEQREKYLEQTLKDIQDARALKKFQDEQKLLATQSRVNVQNDAGGSGSKWYFYNMKVKGSGFNDYKAQWGTRTLEDNWRRSTKTSFNFDEENPDSVLVTDIKPKDSLSVDDLRASLPLTPEAMDSSNRRILNSLYMLGIIYKEQLKEESEAISYFKKVIDRNIEHPRVLASMYQLYLIYTKKGSAEANTYKEMILEKYPTSEIAEIMRDPDYLKKKEEDNKKELNDYSATLNDYQTRNYGMVIYRCNEVIAYDTTNKFLYKYFLLKAFAISKTDPGNSTAIASPLQQLYDLAPKSEEGKQAKIYLDKINNGLNIIEPDKVDTTDLNLYSVNASAPHFVILVYPNDMGNIEPAKIKLSNFNNEFFKTKRYQISNSPLDANNQLLIVKTFTTTADAKLFIESFKSNQAKVTLGTMGAELEAFIIHSANFSALYSSKNLEAYRSFYLENY